MKKFLALVIAGLLTSSTYAFAHCGTCGVGEPHGKDTAPNVSDKVDMMAKELKLTDEQKDKVKSILNEKMDKKEKIMDDKSKAMDALHDEFKTKLGSVLTPEQMKNWEDMKKKADDHEGKCPLCKEGKMCEECMKAKGQKDKEHDHK